jgi:hypothetical protein
LRAFSIKRSLCIPFFRSLLYQAERGDRSAATQTEKQIVYLFCTLGISIFAGVLTSLIVTQSFCDPQVEGSSFLDEDFWEVPEDEIPYFYDHRGEVTHTSQNDQRRASKLMNKGGIIVDENALGKVAALIMQVKKLQRTVDAAGLSPAKTPVSPAKKAAPKSKFTSPAQKSVASKRSTPANTPQVDKDAKMMAMLESIQTALLERNN